MFVPGLIKEVGFILGPFALPLAPLVYWLGKRDWRQNWNEYQMEPPDRGPNLVKRWLLSGNVLLWGNVVEYWYMQGARVAASEAGMTR